MEYIAVIITSFFTLVSGIIVAWFTYNQTTKNKMTDLKIEKLKKDTEERSAKNNRNIALIYGELWGLLHKLDADRCFIIQPHPIKKFTYISAVLEVDRKGVSYVHEILQDIPMGDVAGFVGELQSNRFIYWNDIENQVTDLRAKALMRLSGVNTLAIKQLVNSNNDWIGNLVVENITKNTLNNEFQEIIKNIANTIQFILPPIN